MTRHKHAHIGLLTPPLPQLLLTAVLHVFAMLVLHVASTLEMIRRRTRVNATRATPTDLPQAKTDTQPKETHPVAASDPAHPCAHLTACHPGNAKRYPTHCESTTHHQWFPALATLGRDDNHW